MSMYQDYLKAYNQIQATAEKYHEMFLNYTYLYKAVAPSKKITSERWELCKKWQYYQNLATELKITAEKLQKRGI